MLHNFLLPNLAWSDCFFFLAVYTIRYCSHHLFSPFLPACCTAGWPSLAQHLRYELRHGAAAETSRISREGIDWLITKQNYEWNFHDAAWRTAHSHIQTVSKHTTQRPCNFCVTVCSQFSYCTNKHNTCCSILQWNCINVNVNVISLLHQPNAQY